MSEDKRCKEIEDYILTSLRFFFNHEGIQKVVKFSRDAEGGVGILLMIEGIFKTSDAINELARGYLAMLPKEERKEVAEIFKAEVKRGREGLKEVVPEDWYKKFLNQETEQ